MKKRLLSILLAICMIVSLAPTVLAADADLTISDEAGLKAFAEAVNGGNTYEGKTVVLANSITLSGEWTPIGNGTRSGNSYTGYAFKGTFDGGNFPITGLTITSTTGADAALGLFGVVDGGTVKNLNLTDVSINVADSECAGGAIGVLTGNGTADSITVSGSISAKRGNGGVVGRMLVSGTISNCINNATMTATGGANLGGIVGAAYYTAESKTMIISNCTNNGTVSGSAGGVGGIVGLSAANVSHCTNTAVVSAKGASVGGIVGEQQNYGSIINCTNSAKVAVSADSGQYGTGGIVGWIRYNGTADNYPLKGVVEVKNNTNSGEVVGASDAGGIVGTVYHAAEVSGNTNVASSLTAVNFAAGIVANFQFSDTYYGDSIPQQELNLQNNVSSTALENISANYKNLYVYDNSFGSQDGTIAENSGAWVAQIGSEKYATLQAAVDAANNETVTVLASVVLTKTLTIPAGKTVAIDLNGKTISYETTESKAEDMIVNKGDLTITDSSTDKDGKFSYKYSGAPNTSYSYDNASIQNEGVLTIEAGTVENTTAAMSHASYAINTNAGATLNVKGGKVLNLNGHAIRQTSFGTATNTVNISDGYIEGTRAVQFQLPGSASATTAPEMILNIIGGELKSSESTYNLAVYVYSNGQSAENANISVSGDAVINGNIALNDAATDSMVKGAASVTGGTINGDYGIFSYADTDTNNAISITGGTFATNYSEMYAEDDGYAFETNDDDTYGVIIDPEQTVFAASIDGIGYDTLQNAIKTAQDGDTIKLLKDYSDYKMIQIGKSIAIDLNGHNINRTFGGIAVDITDGDVVITGTGKISGSTTGIAIAYDAALTLEEGVTVEGRDGYGVDNDGDLTIDGATITATEYGVVLYSGDDWAASLEMLDGSVSGQYGVAAYANTSVTVKGGTISGAVAGLSGEGGSHGTTFDIEGGTIQSEDGVGIYHPQNGELNISGGTVIGATGINMKSGELNITGGTIQGTGEKADYSFIGGGFNCTGDALVIESCGYPGGAPVVSITGGTFESENASAVASYVGNNVTDVVTDFISGGTYSDENAESYLADGFVLDSYTDDEGNTVYGVEPVYTVTITVTPTDAAIVVKDSENNVVNAEDDGTYELINGTYTYAVSKGGYTEKTGSFTVNGVDVSFSVSLSVYIPYVPSDSSYHVAVEASENGDIHVTPSYATKGQTVTITVDPDKGYVLETLTVTDKNGNEIDLTAKGDGKYTFKMPASKVTVEATFMEDNTMLNYFVDVFASDYYYDAVLWAVENDITNGTSATTFSPNAVCTRAQVVTFLWRAAGEPAAKSTDMPFTDVAEGSYYYDAVLWAVENGITNGTSATTFSPDADCTRGQIVTFLWRSQGSEDASANNPFVDVTDDAYYTEAVLWAVENDITNGTGATTFSPDADCTRGQIVTFLYRCLAE